MTAVAAGKGKRFSREKKHPPLISGRPVRLRGFQKLIWIGISALLGAGFIAGLYWYGLQQDWHNIFPFLPPHSSLKLWYDNGMGFIHSKNWSNGTYRHGIRDNGEPEMWALVGGVLLGASRSQYVIRMRWLIPAGVVLLAMIIAGALGITWFINFGPARGLHGAALATTGLLLGLALGRVLHMLWMPLGSSIRYQMIASAGRGGGTPLWVTLPLAPPALRETWSEMKRDGKLKAAHEKKDRFRQSRVLVPLSVLLFLVIAISGDLAKWGFAHGLHVPFLNP